MAHAINPVAADAAVHTAQALARPDAVVANAVFEHAGLRVTVDLATPEKMIELGTSVRPPRRLNALALKLWVAEACGWQPPSVVVTTVDPRFEYRGDYRGIWIEHDVTAEVRRLASQVPGWVRELDEALAAGEPAVEPGRQCLAPTLCAFAEHCARPAAEYPVTDLRAAPALVRSLQQAGYDDLREVPARLLQKPLHRRMHRAAVSGEPQLDPELAAFAAELAYPRAYLDFEAVQFALPIWEGTRPYQALPFQWSCLVELAPGELEEYEFLDLSGAAPMRACAQRLVEALPSKGPVVVYGDFESRTLSLLAEFVPELAPALRAIRTRIVDLLPWVQRHYYHRDMHGGWSLKTVLNAIGGPTETEATGAGAVSEGLGAQRAYLEAIDERTSEPQRQRLAQMLRNYCRGDTIGLRRLVEYFAAAHAWT